MISKELHSRCFLDNFWLTWLKKIGVWTKNRSNKSFLGDKLKLLNSRGGGKEIMIAARARQQARTSSERRLLDNMSISLWVRLCERGSLGNLIYFDDFTHTKKRDSEHFWWMLKKKEEKNWSSWSLRPQEDFFFFLKKKKVRQQSFVDHCQRVYWTRRCCLTFGSSRPSVWDLTFAGKKLPSLSLAPSSTAS